MKRRDFVTKVIPATVLTSILNGFSVKGFAADSPLAFLLGAAPPMNDHVLVLVRLTGGNDGLNTVIPLDIYSNYHNARVNIAIPENKVLPLSGIDKSGLNPVMTGMQSLFNEGKLGIIQSVGYPQPSFSHFRATDIWMSGSDSDEVLINGWAGRYLDYEYPGFPVGYPNPAMTDPLAIQIGSVTSLTLQGTSANMGMSISNPTSFYNFLNGVEDPAPNNNAGKELKFIRTVARQTQQYSSVIKDAAEKVTQQSSYPSNNSLAAQLQIVAKLVKGGLRTRVYMVEYKGFDTHSLQTDPTDTTVGTHANLLKAVSDAIKAFQDDLKFLNIEERVVGMTFSEFGRRIKSNSSGGTDHGTAAPVFVFGKNVNAAVLGNSPDVPQTATVNDNITMQYDFRSVYASLLENWLCVQNTDLQQIMLKDFQNLPIIRGQACNPTIFTFTGSGNWNDPANWNSTIAPPSILPAGSEIIINPSPGGECILNVGQTISQGSKLTVLADKKFTIQGNLELK